MVWNHPNGECFIANGVGHLFYGNTCWNNSTGVDLYTSSSPPSTGSTTIENNIFAKNITPAVHIESGVSVSTLVFDYNDYDGGVAYLLPSSTADLSAWQAMGLDTHSLVDDPKFVNLTPAVPEGFVLQTSSPLTTSGLNLGLPFATGLGALSTWPASVQTTTQGTQWSMGAFPQKP